MKIGEQGGFYEKEGLEHTGSQTKPTDGCRMRAIILTETRLVHLAFGKSHIPQTCCIQIVATKWYTSARSLGAGEGWVYHIPSKESQVKVGDGVRVVGRNLPFGWTPESYPEQQIGSEQFVWSGRDMLIYSKNVAEESDGAFEYSKGECKMITVSKL